MLDINEIRKLYEEGHYKYKLPEEATLKTLPLDYVMKIYLLSVIVKWLSAIIA